MMEIVIHGMPGPQGSKRFVGMKNGRGMMIESSKKVRPWRDAVKTAALEAMGGQAGQGIKGALVVEMIFTLPKPASAPKTRRTVPDRKPDLSKLVRSTEDALTEIGAWEDDARIVRCLSSKVYPNQGKDALPVPGAVVRILAES